MAVITYSSTRDATDKEQARGFFLESLINKKEMEIEFSDLTTSFHINNVQDVKTEVIAFTKFVGGQGKNKNFWEDHRRKVNGDIQGLATALTFRFDRQRNFTHKDVVSLESHLKTTFPNLKINVVHIQNKPRCIVHIGV